MLLLVSIIILLCVILNRISNKFGIPMLLGFILLGMLFGADGIFKIDFNNYAMGEQICSVALIFIMFYGGFGTSWSAAKPIAGKAVLLSTVGVALTSGILGVFCHFVLKMDWAESLLLGSVVGSTDAASVFSILRSKRLNLKYNTASLLEVESGSNDPCSYMLTVIMLSVINGGAEGISFWGIVYMIFSQLVYGAVIGAVIAFLAIKFLKYFKFPTAGFDTIFVVAVALVSYALPSLVGGNGYLSAYIVGVALGNQKIKNKKTLVHFFDGMTGLMQMLVFFLLGLLAYPSKLPAVAGSALIIALFLTFVARPAAIFMLLTPFKCKVNQQLFISWAGLRGAASIVFAVMAIQGAPALQHDLFHIIFFIVLFSILLQGSLIPFAAKKMNMIDENADVLKTFTDYTDEVPVQFIQLRISEGHYWANKKIKNIVIPPDTIIVMLQRDGKNIVPNGSTEILAGDTIVIGASAPVSVEGINLTEKRISAGDELIGKTLMEASPEPDRLIIMIQRSGNIIIPRGKTQIKENDILVINQIDG